MLSILRTNTANSDFLALVKQLDAELAIRDGADHPFYDQFNKLDKIKEVVIVYKAEKALACGAIKPFDETTMEVKRMFVLENYRGRGIAAIILKELEQWTIELGFTKCILETGYNQPEAIRLYLKSGYCKMDNYGQYAGLETSVCFKKHLVGI
jgi:putative acetyltransferase